MLQMHSLATLEQIPNLRDEMFRDRKKQFIDRLDWQVASDRTGREIDAYDLATTQYLIYCGENGEHLGSLRLNSCMNSCMVKEVFGEEFPETLEYSSNEIEVTRFCVSPKLTGNRTRNISSLLMKSAFFFVFAQGIKGKLVGVCNRPMLRIYRRSNASPTSVFYGKKDRNLILTKWRVEHQSFLNFLKNAPQSENLQNRRNNLIEEENFRLVSWS